MLLVRTSLSTGQRVSHQGSESVCLALGEHTGFIVLALNEIRCVAHEETTAARISNGSPAAESSG